MRKRYLAVFMIILILIGASFYLMSSFSSPLGNPNEPQNQGNETSTPNVLPFRFPWEAAQTTTNKSASGGTGGGGTGGGGTGGGGTGGGGTGSEGTEPEYIPGINYTLNVDSLPEGLKIFANYYINNVKYSLTSDAPFNLEVDPSTPVCVLPASITGNGTLKWTLDGQDCPISVCETPSYVIRETLYSDYGCLINMDANHSVTFHYTST